MICDPCQCQFETADAMSDHYLISPRHPKCMVCSRGFKDEQDVSLHLASEHPGYAPGSSIRYENVNFAGTSPRNLNFITKPFIDSPILSLRAGFASPIMDVKAPIFSPSSLPPPGGYIDELWTMRENVQTSAIPRQLTGGIENNGLNPSLGGPSQRRSDSMTLARSSRDPSSLSSLLTEPSPLSNELIPSGQDVDELYSPEIALSKPFMASDWRVRDALMPESDPIVPLHRRSNSEAVHQPIGTGVKGERFNTAFGTHTLYTSDDSHTAPSFNRQSFSPIFSTAYSLASPSSSTSGSSTSAGTDPSFVMSSPVVSSFLQHSDGQAARGAKRPEMILSAIATPVVVSSGLEFPDSVEAGLTSSPKYQMISPTNTKSPDVSSPLGLAALPSMSPLATTPIDPPHLLRGKSNPFDFPEANFPLPDSPLVTSSMSPEINEPCSPWSAAPIVAPRPAPLGADRDDLLSVATLKPSTDSPQSASPAESFRTTAQELPGELMRLDDLGLREESFSAHASDGSPTLGVRSRSASFSRVVGAEKEGGKVASPNPFRSRGYNAGKLIVPTDAVDVTAGLRDSETSPTTAVDVESHSVDRSSVARLLRCRLCQVDVCRDPTATMCGHLFCYGFVCMPPFS
ncbi:hypothetical protein AX17_004727 [Amanita inopinata Kibby_2008]|nr:hypothetical protein AX17_004727 [Amanita inopinata Kibby_2008]